jgi:hypothetical protein
LKIFKQLKSQILKFEEKKNLKKYTMKYVVLLVNSFFVVAMAQHNHQQHNHQQQQIDNKYRHVPIVSHEQNLEHDGTFNYAFETGDGTRVQQNGQLKQSSFDPQNVGEAIQGGYSYTVRYDNKKWQ